MLETLSLLIVILWLVGFLGKGHAGIPRLGNFLHVLLIIAAILIVVSVVT